MAEFFKSKIFKIIVAILAILFGMMLYSASLDGVQNIPKNLLSMIVTPFQKVTATISDATGSFFDIFINAQQNADENKELKAEIDDLNNKIIDYEKLKDENEQLKKITEIKDIYPDYEITPAFVIGRDSADRYGSFTIDKGTLQGIKLNDPVMAQSGLIGYISEVSSINARVKTILNPDTNISAFEISTKELGVTSGDITLAYEGMFKLSILSEETDIVRGLMVVTAGSSGKYPKGLPIGVVEDVFREPHGVTMQAIIKPLVEIDEIISVEVVTDFLGQGSELIDYLE